MKFKIGDMKVRNIINGIFLTGLVYLIIALLNDFSEFLLKDGAKEGSIIALFHSIMYLVHLIFLPVLGFISIILICEILYKVAKTTQGMARHNNNKA